MRFGGAAAGASLDFMQTVHKPMKTSTRSEIRSERPHRAQSPPRPEDVRQPTDADVGGVGEQYLRLFGEPALADAGDTYYEVYHRVLAVLQGNPVSHVHTAVRAAWDAAVTRAENYFSGGQSR